MDEHIVELKRQCDELGMIKSDESYAETTPEIIKNFLLIEFRRAGREGLSEEEKELCLLYIDDVCSKIKFIY